MASILNTKINSYTLRRGIEFNDSNTTVTPTRTGTSSSGSYTLGNITYSTNGPVGGAGSWLFQSNSGTSGLTAFLRNASNSTVTEGASFADSDWSVGFWFRVNSFATPNTATSGQVLLNAGGSGAGILVRIGSGGYLAAPNTLYIQSGGVISRSPALNAGEWYYFAARRVSAGNTEIYLNAQLVLTLNGTATTAATSIAYGDQGTTIAGAPSFNIANYYTTDSSIIGPTEIAEIYAVGAISGTNISVSATPLTASTSDTTESVSGSVNYEQASAQGSALQNEPTIAVTTGDHVEITTTILVDATFPSGISVIGQSNIEIHPDAVATASVEMINNVDISTGSDISFSATEATASADFAMPMLPVMPMTASITSGNHQAYIPPTYYKLVKDINPYLYIRDGQANPTNYGYRTGTFTKGTNLLTSQDAGSPLNMSGDVYSWKATGNPSNLSFATTAANSFDAVMTTGNWAIESWIKTPSLSPATLYNIFIDSPLFSVYFNTANPGLTVDTLNVRVKTTSSTNYTFPTINYAFSSNETYHIVLQSTYLTSTTRQVRLYVNNALLLSDSMSITPWTASDTSLNVIPTITSLFYDEIAFYNRPLTSSEVSQHYNFIATLSPNYTHTAARMTASVQFGNHLFTVAYNGLVLPTPITASVLMVNPSVIAGVSNSISAEPMTASVDIPQPTIDYGVNYLANYTSAYIESNNAYVLTDAYYNYVMANVNPYRYVNFDGANPLSDYGTDNDYAVAATTLNGEIVTPQYGINGRSAKTAGTSYVTDGIILNESEYNDNWGTGLNNYHSSFWIQRALDDTSTNGLRVIWNLNGYYNNQHVILYQYQNKLTLQFNNGSGTHITQSTVANYNLFDGNRHFVAVAFDHTGANSYVNLFVDAVDIMTVNLGSYNGTTINGTTSVPANDEANNHPRLSVGCLITPFGSTALPVVPANTKVYVDEIIWAKSSLSQTLATNLYAAMPNKTNIVVTATAITATALMFNAATSTSVNFVSTAITATALSVNPSTYLEYELIASATPLTASAEAGNTLRSDGIVVAGGVMLASGSFNDGAALITVPGGPMLATAKLQPEITGLVNLYLDGEGEIGTTVTINFSTMQSPYVNYVIKESSISSIARVREVK